MKNIKTYTLMLEEQSSLDVKLRMEVMKWRMADPEVVKSLIEQGADPNSRDREGKTVLMDAVKGSPRKIIDILIDGGADVDAVDRSGHNAIYIAAFHGYEGQMDQLAERGADLNASASHSGMPMLCWAIKEGKWGFAKWLISKGADVDMEDPSTGTTPLMYATAWPSLNIIRLLLSKGADPEKKNREGKNAMWYAKEVDKNVWRFEMEAGGFSAREAEGLMRLLINSGANPFTVFKDVDEFVSRFGSDLSWMPEELRVKIKRMQRGKQAFGM